MRKQCLEWLLRALEQDQWQCETRETIQDLRGVCACVYKNNKTCVVLLDWWLSECTTRNDYTTTVQHIEAHLYDYPRNPNRKCYWPNNKYKEEDPKKAEYWVVVRHSCGLFMCTTVCKVSGLFSVAKMMMIVDRRTIITYGTTS